MEMKFILVLFAFIGAQQVYAQNCTAPYVLYTPIAGQPTCLWVLNFDARSWLINHDRCLENQQGWLVEPYYEMYALFPSLLIGQWKPVYAGCYDRVHEGLWYWSSDGTLVNTSTINWGFGQPDGSTAENCCCLCTDGYTSMCTCDCLDKFMGICQVNPT